MYISCYLQRLQVMFDQRMQKNRTAVQLLTVKAIIDIDLQFRFDECNTHRQHMHDGKSNKLGRTLSHVAKNAIHLLATPTALSLTNSVAWHVFVL
mgnify:CR=1 FL=1